MKHFEQSPNFVTVQKIKPWSEFLMDQSNLKDNTRSEYRFCNSQAPEVKVNSDHSQKFSQPVMQNKRKAAKLA